MSAERHLNPTGFSDETLDRLAFALIARVKALTVDGLNEKPMTRKQIAAYLGYGQTTITKLINAGVLKGHRFTDDMEPRYLASEALERLKRS